MYGKVFDGFRSGFAWVKSGIGACSVWVCAVAVALLGFADAVLAEGATVTVTPPEIDWGTTAQLLITSMTSVVVIGLGIALSVWALLMVVRLFKRSAA